MTSERPIRVGIVGSGFMAQQHSAAYRLLPNLLGESVPPVALVRMAGGRRVHELGPRGMFLARESATPSFADGLMISRYMQAALASAAEHGVARNTP